LLVPRKLETAQNRKVWAARAKPVLPTYYNFSFIDSLGGAIHKGLRRFYIAVCFWGAALESVYKVAE